MALLISLCNINLKYLSQYYRFIWEVHLVMIKKTHIIFKNIEPGTNLFLRNEQFGELKEKYVGWYPEHYVLITLRAIPGIINFLNSRPHVDIIFINDGRVYTSKSQIMSYVFKPIGLAFLREPSSLLHQSVRSSKRIKCCLPGEIAPLEYSKYSTGIIVDISEKGMGFLFKNPLEQTLFRSEQKVKMRVYIPCKEEGIVIPSIIKRLYYRAQHRGVGVLFDLEQLGDEITIIQNFIKKICI